MVGKSNKKNVGIKNANTQGLERVYIYIYIYLDSFQNVALTLPGD